MDDSLTARREERMKRLLLATAIVAAALMNSSSFAATELTMWYHGAGGDAGLNPEERNGVLSVIDEFNSSQSDWVVKLESFPRAVYNDSVTAAALAGNLPDILDVDGPNMPNWAWSGYMQPLPLTDEDIANFLPGPIGKWQGKLYSIGLWDSAVAIFARKSILDEFGIRIPTLDQPWTGDEFNAALESLKASGKFEYPIDMGTVWTGEWYPYAFSPFLQSFGGDIVDRTTYKTAQNVLNGPEAIAFGEWWQNLFTSKLAPGTSQDPGDRATGFIEGKYALSWNGNWQALPAVEKFGDDLLFLPAPDFGHGSKIGAASWQFGISSTSKHPDGAAAFIKFAIQDKFLVRFSDLGGFIPARKTAAEQSVNYKPGAPLEVFFGLSEKQGFVRPVTPGYVVDARVFEKAVADIANGADVVDTLDAAADEIDADIERNNGYGF